MTWLCSNAAEAFRTLPKSRQPRKLAASMPEDTSKHERLGEDDDDDEPSDSQDENGKSKKDEDREEDEVHEKSAASAHIVYKAILKEAHEELERHSRALAWSGLAAGMSMGFTLVLQALI